MNWWKPQVSSQRVNQLTDPYYRFQSIEELRQAAQLGVRIDVNRADVDDWLRLPGISIRQARSLVGLQQAGVQFHCLEDVAAALGISVERLKPLTAILQFCYYDPDSLDAAPLINPNLASIEQLTKVAAIDLFLARAIVQNRKVGGRYRDMADLQQRLRLPTSLTEQLIHSLKI
ncbi:MAG: ComEA family DNA-binding protein [Leptolyngbyaceae cyanobacterium SL_7_1]|nr:ComEA family DNA-binding protein [Leptolyngbyaceae cyanobacterium SL_7_1]